MITPTSVSPYRAKTMSVFFRICFWTYKRPNPSARICDNNFGANWRRAGVFRDLLFRCLRACPYETWDWVKYICSAETEPRESLWAHKKWVVGTTISELSSSYRLHAASATVGYWDTCMFQFVKLPDVVHQHTLWCLCGQNYPSLIRARFHLLCNEIRLKHVFA